jgi:REP-associated tyrosine transposase
MSEYIHQSHNVSVLMYHLVCPAKYRRVVFDASVDTVLKEVCLEIAKRYTIIFLEIGTDKDHVHFLIQSIPTYSPTKIVKTIKSITAREVFKRVPAVKKQLWGVNFGPKATLLVPLGVMAMKKSYANMSRNKAANRHIRSFIVKMSRWSCFEGFGF